MKNYWIYFFSSLISLLGSNLFIFTQGWYLLEVTGENATVALTWSLFFLPSLLLLPAIGVMFDRFNLKRLLVGFEVAKVMILLSFAILLKLYPTKELAYLLSILYGISFVPYYPSVYVVIKHLVSQDSQTKYSHLTEMSLQISNIIAVFASGFIFNWLGFHGLLGLSAAMVALGLMLLLSIHFEQDHLDGRFADILGGYRRVVQIAKDLTDTKSDHRILYGLIHATPQAVIMVSNVPLLLYVSDKMRGGPIEFGIIDSLIGVAGLMVSILWARWTKLSERLSTNVFTSVFAALALIVMAQITPNGVWPYLWTGIYGGLLISSKILARATVVNSFTKSEIGTYSTLFQLTGYMIMMGLFMIVNLLSHYKSATSMYVFLGGVLLVYSMSLHILGASEAKMKKAHPC